MFLKVSIVSLHGHRSAVIAVRTCVLLCWIIGFSQTPLLLSYSVFSVYFDFIQSIQDSPPPPPDCEIWSVTFFFQQKKCQTLENHRQVCETYGENVYYTVLYLMLLKLYSDRWWDYITKHQPWNWMEAHKVPQKTYFNTKYRGVTGWFFTKRWKSKCWNAVKLSEDCVVQFKTEDGAYLIKE